MPLAEEGASCTSAPASSGVVLHLDFLRRHWKAEAVDPDLGLDIHMKEKAVHSVDIHNQVAVVVTAAVAAASTWRVPNTINWSEQVQILLS